MSRLCIMAIHLAGVLFALNERLEMINETHKQAYVAHRYFITEF